MSDDILIMIDKRGDWRGYNEREHKKEVKGQSPLGFRYSELRPVPRFLLLFH